ncbi:MAG: helix-turn-helix domain-containing protein [Oscillospiraceae bacterium]|nr:helix-turn-helix domain-containing protein [Oscillospiraceae bacterium]
MSTLDKILNLLNKQKKTQKELTDYLSISKATFSQWKSNENKSYMKHLPKIAVFLGVSVDSLLDDEQVVAQVAFTLTEHEKRLVAAYRNKPEMQASVDKLLDVEESVIENDVVSTVSWGESTFKKETINTK